MQQTLDYRTPGRSTLDVTADVAAAVAKANVEAGLCHVFIRHTSASLMICENADPDVRADVERWLTRTVVDGDPMFAHDVEGDDDMPGHIRSILTGMDVTVPITAGRLNLGTWQGIFLYEHRSAPHHRELVVTCTASGWPAGQGEKYVPASNDRGLTGGCACGRVRLAIGGRLRPVIACHCETCRRTSGHYWAATEAYTADVRIDDSGALKWFASSDFAERGFCAECGSSLFYHRRDSDRISIAGGALDLPTGLSLPEHICVAEAGDYYTIDAETTQQASHRISAHHRLPPR